MWAQMLFSKKNRNLKQGSQKMDEFHVLTGGPKKVPYEVSKEINALARGPSLEGRFSFIRRSSDGLFIGLFGDIADILGADHEFAREAKVLRGDTGKGRLIQFRHVYHAEATAFVPVLAQLRQTQAANLLEILTRAHDGQEPVEMEPVTWDFKRDGHGDWNWMATRVEAGESEGGFFSFDGTLIKQFPMPEAAAPELTKKKRAGGDVQRGPGKEKHAANSVAKQPNPRGSSAIACSASAASRHGGRANPIEERKGFLEAFSLFVRGGKSRPQRPRTRGPSAEERLRMMEEAAANRKRVVHRDQE